MSDSEQGGTVSFKELSQVRWRTAWGEVAVVKRSLTTAAPGGAK